MSYLKSMKKIRELKDITQREMFPESSSHSIYAKIENGTTELKMNALEEILERLELSVEEFIYMSNYDRDMERFITYFRKAGMEPENKIYKNILLKEYFPKNKNIQSLSKKELVYFCCIKNQLHDKWEKVKKLTEDELNYVCSLMISKSFYSQYDYTIILNIMSALSEENIEMVIENMFPLKNIEERTAYIINTAFFILTNAITKFIYTLDYKKAWSYVDLAESMLKYTTGYYSKINLEFSKCIIQRFLKRDTAYIAEARKLIELTKLVGNKSIANAFEEELNNLSEKADFYLDLDHYPSVSVSEG